MIDLLREMIQELRVRVAALEEQSRALDPDGDMPSSEPPPLSSGPEPAPKQTEAARTGIVPDDPTADDPASNGE